MSQGGTVSAMTINKGILLGFVPTNDTQVRLFSCLVAELFGVYSNVYMLYCLNVVKDKLVFVVLAKIGFEGTETTWLDTYCAQSLSRYS